MLFVVIVFATIYVYVMNWLVFTKAETGYTFFVGLAPIGLIACSFVSPVMLAMCLGLTVLFALHRRFSPDNRWLFFRLSLVISVGLFVVAGVASWLIQRDLRDQFPLESMADRVPEPKPNKRPLAHPQPWADLEKELEGDTRFQWRGRNTNLRQLHEETTQNFISSPGFGSMRGPEVPTRADQFEYHPDEKPHAYLDLMPPQYVSTDVLEKPYGGAWLANLNALHFAGVRDFVNVKGFGYVKDRQHVAGFYPHQFSTTPSNEKLRITRLELVSLSMHERPVVYVSKDLPRMRELKKAATRPLNDLEAMGLAKLEAGDDLFVREIDGAVHMLGALRSVAQCVQCHGRERGDLLGAFSYSMQVVGRP